MKMLKVVVAVIGFAAANMAFAGKVVVLDLQQAILLTELAKERQKAVAESAEFAGLRGQAESLRAELEALDKKAQSEGLTWSPDQVAEHKKNVEFVQGDLQRVIQKVQASQQTMMQGILSAVKEEFISQALMNIVKSEGIDIVLRKEAANFSTPESDITLKLAAELNKTISADKK